MTEEDIEAQREAGWSDEEILEAVFVAVAFNMIDRLADALGIGADDIRADIERIAKAMGGGG